MENLKNSSIVRYKKDGENFEIICDYEKLLEFREKRDISIYDVVCDEEIYFSVKNVKRAANDSLKKVFSNDNKEKILEMIILNGECQIPSAYLKKKTEELKEKIVEYLFNICINPQTNSRFSKQLIESEVLKTSYNYNPEKNFIFQAEEILKKLQSRFPISINFKTIILTVPSKYSGKFLGDFRKFGKIEKEMWDNHGSLKLHIKVNQNNLDEVIEYIKSKSNNEAEYYVEN